MNTTVYPYETCSSIDLDECSACPDYLDGDCDAEDPENCGYVQWGCTCVSVGPRGGKSCPFCLDYHKKYFPAFPGEPGWHLNHGAIARNGWGILSSKIGRSDEPGSEQATLLQIEGCDRELEAVQLHLRQLLKSYGGIVK